MKHSVAWTEQNEPIGLSLDQLLYRMRRHDSQDGLLFDSVTLNEILQEEGVEQFAFDALVSPFSKLKRKMDILSRTMDRAIDGYGVIAMQVSDPFKRNGVAQVAAVFELADGQTVSVYFHNPDNTPGKLAPTDEMISWKWLLNKKDITIVVAPERGNDLQIREVARRIMKLAQKNSAAFAKANAKRAERLEMIEGLRTEISDLEYELSDLQDQIEVAKVEAESRAMAPYKAVKAAGMAALNSFRKFLSRSQYRAMVEAIEGEEGAGMADRAKALAAIIEGMAATYDQDGKGDNATVYLHYFQNSADWFITEKDAQGGTQQAFGYADMGQGGELGYISIDELTKNGVELDLYFDPKPLKAVKPSSAGTDEAEADLAKAHAELDGRIDALSDDEAQRMAQALELKVGAGKDSRDVIKQQHPDDQRRGLELIASQSEASESTDPTTPEGYAAIMDDEAALTAVQDQLDSHFQARMIEVRNALRELGWEGERFKTLSKNGVEAVFDLIQVGAGANVAGMTINGIRDDLSKTPAELAAEVDALAEPVIEIAKSYRNYVDDADGDLFEAAKAFFKAELQGKVVKTVIGDVHMTGGGFREMKRGMKSDELKARLLPSVPDILSSGRYDGRSELHKPRNDGYVAFHFFEKEVELDALIVTAGVNVGERNDKALTYTAYGLGYEGGIGWKNKAASGGVLDAASFRGKVFRGPGVPSEPTTKPGSTSFPLLTMDSSVGANDEILNLVILKVVDKTTGEELTEYEDAQEVEPIESDGIEEVLDEPTAEQVLINDFYQAIQDETAHIESAIAGIDWDAITDVETGNEQAGALRDAVKGYQPVAKALEQLGANGINDGNASLAKVFDSDAYQARDEAMLKLRETVDSIHDLGKDRLRKAGEAELASLPEDASLEDVAKAIFRKHGIDLGEATSGRAAAIVEGIEEKNAEMLRGVLLAGNNPASNEIFEYATGIKLAKTQKQRGVQIDDWAGISEQQRADIEAAKVADREAEELAREVSSAWDELGRSSVRSEQGIQDGQRYLMGFVDAGVREIGTAKKGAATVYGLRNNDGLISVSGKSFNRFLKAATAYGGLMPALELVGAVATKSQEEEVAQGVGAEAVSDPEQALQQAREQTDRDPTDEQKVSGDYQKGELNAFGLTLAIENPKGHVRSGKNEGGDEWQVSMAHDYGYIKGTKGLDGDEVDAFIGPNLESEKVFVIEQVDSAGVLDEHKVMLGFDDEESAKQGYLSSYKAGWDGLGAIREMSLTELKEWLPTAGGKSMPSLEPEPAAEPEPVEPEAMTEPDQQAVEPEKQADTDYLQSIIDQTIADPLASDIADKLGEIFGRNAGDAEMETLIEQAAMAYQNAVMQATANL
jgi:hypothetical protein